MRVTQVLYSGLGGHGSVAFSLLRASREAEADRRHWDCSMLFVGIEPVVADYADACKNANVDSVFVRTKRGRSWAAWTSIYRALTRTRPQAIILHSVKTILPCALYARRHRIPILAVEHQPNALKSRTEWWVSRWLMALADRVVVLTPEYRKELKHALGTRWIGDKVHLIPNGIDTGIFRPVEPAKRTALPCLIGMAGRMTGAKRQDLLIAAMGLLCAKDGRDAWRLSLAGDGDCMAGLRERTRSMQLEDVIDFPGYLGEAALREWFSRLDFYAHASDGETLSTSILQALAMSLPVVGSDVPGISNLLAEGEGVGFAVAQTPQAFADAFRQLSAKADQATALRRRARTLAVERYSQSTMFLQYRDLLDSLCAR